MGYMDEYWDWADAIEADVYELLPPGYLDASRHGDENMGTEATPPTKENQ